MAAFSPSRSPSRGHAGARGRTRRPPRPLGRAALEELALAYVARFATSAGKLETYLSRKLRERGWDDGADGTGEPDGAAAQRAVAEILDRFIANGYVDDEGFARGRSRSLTARGYGPRRVDAALREAGIAEDLRAAARPDERRQRQAALDMARKRGFGPFDRADKPPDDAKAGYEALAQTRAREDKQLAAMLRAGHSFDIARVVLAFRGVAEAERWVDEAEDGAEDEE